MAVPTCFTAPVRSTLLPFAEKGQFGLSEFSQLLLDQGCQLPKPGSSQHFQSLIQTCRAKLDDLLEFGQSCFDARAQLIKAVNLIWVVGNCLPQCLKQPWNLGLRKAVAVEVAALACQQIPRSPDSASRIALSTAEIL